MVCPIRPVKSHTLGIRLMHLRSISHSHAYGWNLMHLRALQSCFFPVNLLWFFIITTLEISLLLQTKVIKNCYHHMHYLGYSGTEMCWRPWTPLGELTVLPLGELTALPQTTSWIWGAKRRARERTAWRGGKAISREGKRRWRKKVGVGMKRRRGREGSRGGEKGRGREADLTHSSFANWRSLHHSRHTCEVEKITSLALNLLDVVFFLDGKMSHKISIYVYHHNHQHHHHHHPSCTAFTLNTQAPLTTSWRHLHHGKVIWMFWHWLLKSHMWLT